MTCDLGRCAPAEWIDSGSLIALCDLCFATTVRDRAGARDLGTGPAPPPSIAPGDKPAA